MKILCIGDSMGLPREECPYESTWFYKLKDDFREYEFIDFFLRGLKIKSALQRYDTYFQYYDAEMAIIQTGIVDCSPRYIREDKIVVKFFILLSKAVGMEKLFWKLAKIGGRRENCVYTKYDEFKEAYWQLVSKLIGNGVKKIILVKIGHATDEVLIKSPSFNKNADKYNKAIDSFCEQDPENVVVINPLQNVEKDDFADGYHCTPKGMEKVYKALKKEIIKYAAEE